MTYAYTLCIHIHIHDICIYIYIYMYICHPLVFAIHPLVFATHPLVFATHPLVFATHPLRTNCDFKEKKKTHPIACILVLSLDVKKKKVAADRVRETHALCTRLQRTENDTQKHWKNTSIGYTPDKRQITHTHTYPSCTPLQHTETSRTKMC